MVQKCDGTLSNIFIGFFDSSWTRADMNATANVRIMMKIREYTKYITWNLDGFLYL